MLMVYYSITAVAFVAAKDRKLVYKVGYLGILKLGSLGHADLIYRWPSLPLAVNRNQFKSYLKFCKCSRSSYCVERTRPMRERRAPHLHLMAPSALLTMNRVVAQASTAGKLKRWRGSIWPQPWRQTCGPRRRTNVSDWLVARWITWGTLRLMISLSAGRESNQY